MVFAVEVPEGMRAEWVNGVLTLVGISCFDDCLSILGNHPYARSYDWIISNAPIKGDVGIVLFMQLRIIAEAFNKVYGDHGVHVMPTVNMMGYTGQTEERPSPLTFKSEEACERAGRLFYNLFYDYARVQD